MEKNMEKKKIKKVGRREASGLAEKGSKTLEFFFLFFFLGGHRALPPRLPSLVSRPLLRPRSNFIPRDLLACTLQQIMAASCMASFVGGVQSQPHIQRSDRCTRPKQCSFPIRGLEPHEIRRACLLSRSQQLWLRDPSEQLLFRCTIKSFVLIPESLPEQLEFLRANNGLVSLAGGPFHLQSCLARSKMRWNPLCRPLRISVCMMNPSRSQSLRLSWTTSQARAPPAGCVPQAHHPYRHLRVDRIRRRQEPHPQEVDLL